jgi:hypothetical protein
MIINSININTSHLNWIYRTKPNMTTYDIAAPKMEYKIRIYEMLHLSMFSFDICKCFRNPTQHSHFIQSTYCYDILGKIENNQNRLIFGVPTGILWSPTIYLCHIYSLVKWLKQYLYLNDCLIVVLTLKLRGVNIDGIDDHHCLNVFSFIIYRNIVLISELNSIYIS